MFNITTTAACDECGTDVTGADRYWWHKAIADELARLRDKCDMPAYNVPGIAGNVRMSVTDVRKYVDQMIEWGELVSAQPLWDYLPEQWVALAEV